MGQIRPRCPSPWRAEGRPGHVVGSRAHGQKRAPADAEEMLRQTWKAEGTFPVHSPHLGNGADRVGLAGKQAGGGAGGLGGQVDREGQAMEVLTVRVTSVTLPRTQEATSHGRGSRPGTCSTWPEGPQQHKDGADRAGAEDKISKGETKREAGTGLAGGPT